MPKESSRKSKQGTPSGGVNFVSLETWAEEVRKSRGRKTPRTPRLPRPPKPVVDRSAHMRGAAQRFTGLSAELQMEIDMRYITAKRDGFLVQFSARGVRFTRWIGGLSDESFSAALDFRDEAEPIFARQGDGAVPARVLSMFGLRAPVRGIYRRLSEIAYVVKIVDAQGKARHRSFSFRDVPEEDAYASAIAFLEQNKGKLGGKT